MKRAQHIHRLTLVSTMITFLGACSPLEGASTKESVGLDQWVAKYVSQDEKLLCKRDENGEYFFIAQKDEKVKAGSRLDVTRAPGDRSPKAFLIAWKFQNEKDGHLATKVPPTTVKEGYDKDSDKTYSEQIEYQTLHLKGSEKMHVTIDIKKCPTNDCDRQQTKGKGEKAYSIKLCEVALSK